MLKKKIELNLLLKKDYYVDGAWWIAQCVEYDIVCQARTPKGALEEFTRTLIARVVLAARRGTGDPFASLRPAPEDVRRYYELAKGKALKLDVPDSIRIPGIGDPVGLHAQLQP